MKYVRGDDDTPTVLEMTRRNLETLLAKLDDPASARTFTKQEDVGVGNHTIVVTAVEDAEHYSDRPAGVVYMPTSGAWL